MAKARVTSVNIGRAADAPWAGARMRTAIDKRPVITPVPAGVLGLAGDEQAGQVDHRRVSGGGAGSRVRQAAR